MRLLCGPQMKSTTSDDLNKFWESALKTLQAPTPAERKVHTV